ncbi:Thiosulfate sulfurtransferase GlpE [Streptomyces griseomycini]
MLNPFGSVKDRPAWHMARPHLEGAAGGDGTVVELSSGNTAKALALLAGLHGLRFKSVTNRMRVPEIKELLLLLGAEIEELPGRSECLDPTDTDDPLTHFHRALAAALTDAEARAEARVIGVDDARRWTAQGDPRPLVVDLRSPHAYAALHIEGSVNIVDELFEELVRGGLPFDKRTPVLLACPVGEKSLRHAALLTRMGHPDVRSLAGGIVAWRDAGAPLVRA